MGLVKMILSTIVWTTLLLANSISTWTSSLSAAKIKTASKTMLTSSVPISCCVSMKVVLKLPFGNINIELASPFSFLTVFLFCLE
jgi:hypothetical protein